MVERGGDSDECSMVKAPCPRFGRQVRSAAMTDAQKRIGLLSSLSRESHATVGLAPVRSAPSRRFQARLRLRGESHPCGEQRGFATSSRGRDERQGMRAHRIQFIEQAGALHKRGGQAGTRKPGREQHSPLLSRRLRVWPGFFSPSFCSAGRGSLFLMWCAQRGRGGLAFEVPSPLPLNGRTSPWPWVRDSVYGCGDLACDRHTNNLPRVTGLL